MNSNEYEKTCACGETLSLEMTGAPCTVTCPACGKRYDIRPTQVEILSVTPVEEMTSRCPYCAEKTRAGALKCPHCQEFLKATFRRTVSPQAVASVQEEGVLPFILAILGVVVCGFFFPVAWYVAVERETSVRARRLPVPDLLVAAKWIGKIGTILMVAGFFLALLFLSAPALM
jgi:hypothetical protein